MDEEERKARLTARFAGARKRLLSIRHPAEYSRLERAGELESHLTMIGEEAADHYLTLEAQLKARAAAIGDPKDRHAYLSQIPQMAEEMVMSDIIETRD